MKKFLSLVLALVMTMSLVTISAGAKDFTDDSKLNYKEAVDVMSAIDVIDGYTDGSFNPQGGLTRGAAAKIICNMILGPTTAAALRADTAPFKDVAVDNTFAGYIAYCANEGIIDGYTDGTFRPAAPLTGYAFMKFLLGSLGYDKDIEGYNGANWSINVAKRALNLGLDDGLVDEFVGSKNVTREEACLYAFNTLTADMVKYGQKTTITVGGAEVVVGAGEATKIELSDKKDYRESVRTDDDKTDGYQQFCELYFSNLKLDDVEGEFDVFGRPAQTWYKKTTKIGTYAKTADALYTTDVKAKTIYADLDLSKADTYTVWVDGVENEDLAIIKRDGQIATKKADTKVGDVVTATANGDSDIVGNGSLIEVFEDEGRITVINTYLMKVAADYNEKKETLTLELVDANDYPKGYTAETLSSDDWAGLDEFEEDDMMVVTIADNAIQSIKAIEPETATVNEYVHEESLTAGGETYEYSAANNDNDKAYELKADCKLYLDAYGYLLWADAVKADDQYVFIYEFSKHSTASKAPVNAYAYFTDGTEDDITVTKIGTTTVYGKDVNGTGRDSTVNNYTTGWYKWTEKDGKYTLTSIDAQTGAKAANNGEAIVDYSANHTQIAAGGNVLADGTTKTNFIVLKDDDSVKVYTGIKNIPDVFAAADTVVDVNYKGDYAVNVFIDLGNGKLTGGSNSSDIIFLLKAEKHGNDTDDDEYYRYNALLNGEEVKVKYDKTVDDMGTKAGTLWGDIEYDGKNYVVDATEVTGAVAQDRDEFSKDTVTGTGKVTLTGTTLEIGTQAHNDYYMADDYMIFKIDGSSYEKLTMKQLVREGVDNGATIWGVLNAAGEYTALYIYKA